MKIDFSQKLVKIMCWYKIEKEKKSFLVKNFAKIDFGSITT